MKIVKNGVTYYSIGTVSTLIEVSVPTIKRWYEWYESDDYKKPEGLVLPVYHKLDNRGTKFFAASDVQKLNDFHIDLNNKYRGAMGEFNAYKQWGRRGTRALENRRKKAMGDV